MTETATHAPKTDIAASPVCANCNAALQPKFAYCPACGQSTEPKLASFGEVTKDFLEDYFSFDSKVFRSLVPLLLRPGFLTDEYIRGRRVRYIPPLRMYLTISLLAFLMLAVNKPSRTQYRVADGNISSRELAEIQRDLETNRTASDDDFLIGDAFWDNFFDSTLPKLFFVMVPLYALIQVLLYHRQKRFYMEHLTFSLHFHSFVFVVLLLYMLVSSYLSAGMAGFNRVLMSVLSVWVLGYLFFALKKVYGQNYLRTGLKFGLLVASYTATFVVFSLVALFAYYSLR
ncbi:MAG: DUF3667 domain-containing protein [Cytophagales bacterium]|nr:DUF3667 domain-containing protein [Cytophagales bacterium]